MERFNPAQREAVSNTAGPMLVIAGAGSGKTSVLTTRVALLLSQGVPPERILALTFTKKAAEEMRERIIALQGETARRVVMGTFHSVFIRFLRPFAERLNYPQNFTILDEDDSLSTLKRCIAEVLASGRPPKERWLPGDAERFKEEDAQYKPKLIRSVISICKNELVTADAYHADRQRRMLDERNRRPLLSRMFLAYRDTCHRMAMMDFDDILLYTDMLLANNPDVKAMIAGSFDYILVDEYQDTNRAQYEILKKLTWINKNICVVGDDSQSIYAFRGARIENIMNFPKDYPGCVTVKLEQNYRSTKNIVGAANNLIAKNADRLPKECFSDSDKGQPICIKTTDSERAEAWYVVNTIRSLMRSEGKGYGDFAVLYRTNAQSRAIEDALVRARLPYMVYSGTSFFSRMEVKDLLAYIKLAVNPHDNESFARVVNKPVRHFGDAAQRRLFEVASAWGLSLWDTATNPQIELCGFGPKALAGLRNFTENIRTCMELAATKTAHEAATDISDATGFYESYVREGDEESRRRADNIRELVDSIRIYEEDCEHGRTEDGNAERPTLAGYLQNAMLLTNADTGEESPGEKISLMTVHCAKGLEFDTVFVTGMEKGLFPLEIDGDEFEEEEERRLFYVAMTRAKRRLILTKADSRLQFGKRKTTKPSRFLTEIRSKEARAYEEN